MLIDLKPQLIFDISLSMGHLPKQLIMHNYTTQWKVLQLHKMSKYALPVVPRDSCIEIISWCDNRHASPNLLSVALNIQKTRRTTQQISRCTFQHLIIQKLSTTT